MKKVILSVALFVLAFCGTYLALSVAVPEMANPAITSADHFLAENLRYLAGLKLLLSALIAGFLAIGLWRYRKNQSE